MEQDHAVAQAPADTLGPGTVVDGRYRLASIVARNGNDTVYSALDERSRQRVRLRVTAHAPDPALCKLSHPSIPKVLHSGRVGRWHYVALEWFDGEAVELPTLGVPDRARIRSWATVAMDVLDALEHAHRTAGRAHGDLGLHSLWDGRDGRLRIVDFSGPDGPLSAEAVPYASPERLRGLPRDARSDLYSFACVMYALATGSPPFGLDPIDARSGHLLRRMPEAPGRLGQRTVSGPVLPEPFLAVLRTAMDKQPHHRFASAARMRAAVALALRDLDGATAGADTSLTDADPVSLTSVADTSITDASITDAGLTVPSSQAPEPEPTVAQAAPAAPREAVVSAEVTAEISEPSGDLPTEAIEITALAAAAGNAALCEDDELDEVDEVDEVDLDGTLAPPEPRSVTPPLGVRAPAPSEIATLIPPSSLDESDSERVTELVPREAKARPVPPPPPPAPYAEEPAPRRRSGGRATAVAIGVGTAGVGVSVLAWFVAAAGFAVYTAWEPATVAEVHTAPIAAPTPRAPTRAADAVSEPSQPADAAAAVASTDAPAVAPTVEPEPVAAAPAPAPIPPTQDVPVAFNYDAYQATPQATFPAFVELVRQHAGKVRLTGHTDSRGPAAANYEMGLGRAWAVQQLLWIAGIEIVKVPIASKGETEPVADNATAAGRAKNRRVTAEFLVPDEAPPESPDTEPVEP